MQNAFQISHNQLITYMRALGYPTDNAGICFGLAHMGIQSILTRDMGDFNKQLRNLLSFDPATINDELTAAKAKRARLIQEARDRNGPITNVDQQLTPEEHILLQIPPFMEGIELHHRPAYHAEIFSEHTIPYLQDAMVSSQAVMSEALASRGGLTKAIEFSGVYESSELTSLFKTFNKVLSDQTFAFYDPIAFEIVNNAHAISIGYDNGRWIFIDANDLPAKFFDAEKDLAEKVINALSQNRMATLSARAYVTRDNSNAIEQVVNAFNNHPLYREVQSVTAYKTNRIDSNGTTWLMMAAYNGDLECVNDLLAYPNANPNKKRPDGTTALQLAAQFGHLDVVERLLSNRNLDPNSVDKSGCSALYYAAQNGHLNVVKALLRDLRLDPNLSAYPVPDRAITAYSPVRIANQNGYSEIVTTLLNDPRVDLNQARLDGISNQKIADAEQDRRLLNYSRIEADHRREQEALSLFRSQEHDTLRRYQALDIENRRRLQAAWHYRAEEIYKNHPANSAQQRAEEAPLQAEAARQAEAERIAEAARLQAEADRMAEAARIQAEAAKLAAKKPKQSPRK